MPKINNSLRHLAIIMDGNRRWAQEQKLNSTQGHQAGIKAILPLIDSVIEHKIPYLTLYAFSTENWQRDDIEIESIIQLLFFAIDNYAKDIIAKGGRIKFIGERQNLSPAVKEKIDAVENWSISEQQIQINIAFNYGSRNEIINATKLIIKEVNDHKLELDELNPQLFSQKLYTTNIPEPDLLIRTGGKQRLSNFLLWQCSYSELYFTATLWPDFTPQCLKDAIEDFHQRNRSFGGS